MRWLIVIFIVLLTTAVSADIDSVKATSGLGDAYLDFNNPATNYSTQTNYNVYDHFFLVIGITDISGIIGTNTIDSIGFRIGRDQSGDDGIIELRGVAKWNFQEGDVSYNFWKGANDWGLPGAASEEVIASIVFNETDDGGHDRTTEALDSITGWNQGAGYAAGTIIDSTFVTKVAYKDTLWYILVGINPADGWVATSEHGTYPLRAIIYSTPSACVVTHSLQATDTTLTTIEIENDYTYDEDSTLKAVEMIWDDDDNPADPLGRDSVPIGHPAEAPDTLTATGLSASTQYWFWWIINHGTCDPDTSDALTLFTKSPPPDIRAKYRAVTLRGGKF